MNQSLPQDLDRESLNQLSKGELVDIIIGQNKVIRELQKIIVELQQEIERLKVSRDLDSKISSKPPSGDILKKSENKKAAQHIGEAFVDLIDEAFSNYARWFQALDSVSYNDWVTEFKSKLQSCVAQWINLAGAAAGQLLRSLRDKASQWWYFLDHPEVPPDNNQAERSLRLALTKRKVSGGSRSMERFQHTANLLTVVQTCRRQGRSVINFFVQALLADSLNYQSRPSLLPQY